MAIEIVDYTHATDAELVVMADVLAEAFQHERFAIATAGKHWTKDDPFWHAAFLYPLAAARLEGRIYVIGNFDAILTVFPPGNAFGSDAQKALPQYQQYVDALKKEPAEQAIYLTEAFLPTFSRAKVEAYPDNGHRNSWHCHILGVRSSCQGKGYGPALVRYVMSLGKQGGQTVAIEASVPRNNEIYQHLGFKLMKETAVKGHHNPDFDFTVWMLATAPQS